MSIDVLCLCSHSLSNYKFFFEIFFFEQKCQYCSSIDKMHDCMHKRQSDNKAMLLQYHDFESISSEKITKIGPSHKSKYNRRKI